MYDNKENGKKVKDYSYICLFVFTFVFQTIMLVLGYNGVEMSRDSLGMLNLSSRMAGLDWRPVLGYCQYYGWGLQMLYAIPLLITDNPYIIWIGINLINFLIISVISITIYHIQVKYLKMKRGFISSAVAFSFALMTELDIGKTIGLELGIWLFALSIFWVFVNQGDNRKKIRILKSVLCPIVIVGTQNCHETAIVLYIILAVIVVWDYFIKKNKSVYISAFAFSFIAIYTLSKMIKMDVIGWLVTYRENVSELVNTSVQSQITIWPIESFQNFKLFVYLIFSNILTLNIKTAGMFFLGVIIAMYYVLFKRNYLNSNIILIVMSFFATLIGVAGVAEIWGAGLCLNPPADISGRAYCYVHYYFPFCLPGMLGTISFIRKNTEEVFALKKVILLATIGQIVLFLKYVYPVLANEQLLIIWENTYLLDLCKNNLANILLSCIIIVLVILILVCTKLQAKALAFVILMIGVYVSPLNNGVSNFKEFALSEICSYGGEAYEIVNIVDPDREMVNDIYVYGINKSYGYPFLLQFLLSRYSLIPNADDCSSAKLIFAESEEYKQMLDENLVWIKVSEMQYVATFDMDIAQKIIDYLE